jgi:hypothetical protein
MSYAELKKDSYAYMHILIGPERPNQYPRSNAKLLAKSKSSKVNLNNMLSLHRY